MIEAFKERLNTIGLAAAVVVAVVIHPVMPIVLGVAALAEAGYLLIAPRSEWYMRRLSMKFDLDIARRRAKLKHALSPSIRQEVMARFDHLEQSRSRMPSLMPVQPQWFRELLRKLDYLLDKFLDFAAKEAEFRSYLRSVLDEALREELSTMSPSGGGFVKSSSSKSKWSEEPALDPTERWSQAVVGKIQSHYDSEVEVLNRQRTANTEDLTTNAVLDKRVDVIQRRREYVGQIGKITVNLNNQMELMEDTFGLISDEIRARTPEQILADIDEVIGRTDALNEVLQGFSPAMPATDSPVRLQA